MFKHAPLSFLLLLLALLSGCTMVPRRVAIMDFVVATEDPKNLYLGVAIPEWMTQNLTNYGDYIKLLERQDIHRFLSEIDANPNDPRTLSRWQKLGQKINAQYLIAGSCSRLGQNYILAARLFSVETGQIIPGSATTQACTYDYEIYDRIKRMSAELAWQIKHRSGVDYSSVPGVAPTTGAETPRTAAQPFLGTEGRVTQLPPAADRAPAPELRPVR